MTTWNYDVYRGWLTNKTYDGGTAGPVYTYTAAGRLASRAWARGITTSYSYDTEGQLATVSYSDSTPGVAYGYDRRGRQTQIVQGGTATTTLTYTDQGQMLAESYAGGPQDGLSVTNGYDALLRRTNLVVKTASSVLTSNYFSYDNASRLATVSDGTNSAAYSYVANSPLVSEIDFKQSGTLRMSTTKSYDYLNRLTGIQSANASAVVLDSHNYNYNPANQRTAATNADGTYWAYQYDSLGQVTSGIKHWADGSVVAGQQFGYGFDDIGNRTTTSAGGDQWSANLRYATYSANNLNQYTSRTVLNGIDVIGSATNTATVTVNDQMTYRHSNYYRMQLPINNSSNPVWQSVTNVAVLNEVSDVKIATQTNNIYLPQTPESFSYDADGNLTNDGRWQYTWDAENRLLSMTNITTVPAGARMKLDFAYDAKSRRISKSVTTNVTTITTNFVYDGWNLLAELGSSASVLRSYMWGTDLSGSMQGAGGVGGLLEVKQPGISTNFVSYDGNGNVTMLANASDSTTAAIYEYGPFGEVIRATGPMAKADPFRFSTKYQDDESDLFDYGYRYYNSSTGKWLNRDFKKEVGERNLYGFVLNEPISKLDFRGLEVVTGAGQSIPVSCAVGDKSSPVGSLTINAYETIADGAHIKVTFNKSGSGSCACCPGGSYNFKQIVTQDTAHSNNRTAPYGDFDPRYDPYYMPPGAADAGSPFEDFPGDSGESLSDHGNHISVRFMTSIECVANKSSLATFTWGFDMSRDSDGKIKVTLLEAPSN